MRGPGGISVLKLLVPYASEAKNSHQEVVDTKNPRNSYPPPQKKKLKSEGGGGYEFPGFYVSTT